MYFERTDQKIIQRNFNYIVRYCDDVPDDFAEKKRQLTAENQKTAPVVSAEKGDFVATRQEDGSVVVNPASMGGSTSSRTGSTVDAGIIHVVISLFYHQYFHFYSRCEFS